MTNHTGKWIVFVLFTLLVVFLIAPFASSHPDGLERVAEDHGFVSKAEAGFASAPFPDYLIKGPFADSGWQFGFVGLIGMIIVGGALWGIGKILTQRKRGGSAEIAHRSS